MPLAADQSRVMQDQMTGAAMAMPPDPNKAFKVRHSEEISNIHPLQVSHLLLCLFQSEWEALEIVEHKWALENVEEELMSRDLNFGTFFSRDLKSSMF